MPTKPRLYLLDANVVIELHRQGIWDALLERVQIVLPSIIAYREADYAVTDRDEFIKIDLSAAISTGRVIIEEAHEDDMAAALDHFDSAMRQCIDLGELEALSILLKWPADPPPFCTADNKACEALCLLGLSHLAVSLEDILRKHGFAKALQFQFSEEAHRLRLRKAHEATVQGTGLAKRKVVRKRRK